MNNYKLLVSPSYDDLQITKEWLIEESNILASGFFENWSVIIDRFNSGQLILFCKDEIPIGFTTWFQNNGCACIELYAIDFRKRKRGYGKYFAELLFSYFINQGMFAVKLYCEPQRSIDFWVGKLKFNAWLKDDPCQKPYTYYKILNSPKMQHIKACPVNTLQAFKYACSESPLFSLNLDDVSIDNPIIHPCFKDYYIRINFNGDVIQDTAKYLEVDGRLILRGDFLYFDNQAVKVCSEPSDMTVSKDLNSFDLNLC